ncbi:MAG: DegQ family serine endoprotease [Gammaproteobacteria bacterium]|jgi:serine protease Do
MTSMRIATAVFAFLFLLSSRAVSAQLPDFTELAAQNAPSVVNISTKQKKKLGQQFKNMPEMPKDSPLGELFEHFFGGPFDFDQMPDELFNTESLGSGFVISEDGYILTNHHVVTEADEIIVRFSDRREYVATLIGSDKATDVALVKIEATGLPAVRMGKGNELKVGEWVLAIGSPFGFDHSVTAGIVSAKGRSLPSENYVPFIQTDVAINPGNSGGPLFNLDGEVVGINSQIYSRTGGFMGLSFAIPIEVAMNVADQLRKTGRVSRGWLGVLIQDVTRELAESFGMEQPRGALVARVLSDSPAEKAGVQVGDIIVEFNGRKVMRSSALPPMVGASPVDKFSEVVVLRNGERVSLQVNIGELPDEELAAATAESGQPRPPSDTELLGLTVRELTAAEREATGLGKGGVMVTDVKEGPARTAGIRAGEAIVMVRNHRLEGVEDFRDQLSKLGKGKPVALLVQDEEGSRWLTLTLPDEGE